jgi:tRNA threonylcarbamoyladenosine biosynthesis protein TsaB
MATLLCIETATTNCSVAIAINGVVVALKEDNPKNQEGKKFSHAEKLHRYIIEVLSIAKISKNELEGVAVSKGPGSYTGLRIGVSAAKGICFALDIPLVSIPTLSVLATQVSDKTAIIPMLDARRMEVYSAVFNSAKEQVRSTEAQILESTSFDNYLEEGKVTFIGDGVEKFKTICNHPNALFIEDALPSANDIAVLAEAKYKKSDTEDVAYFEPYYLKDFMTFKNQ